MQVLVSVEIVISNSKQIVDKLKKQLDYIFGQSGISTLEDVLKVSGALLPLLCGLVES